MDKILAAFIGALLLAVGMWCYTANQNHAYMMDELDATGERNFFIFASHEGIKAAMNEDWRGCENTMCLAEKLYDEAVISYPIFFPKRNKVGGK